MKKINWGIIGLGNIANKFADGCLSVDNALIKSIASKKSSSLASFKKKFQIDDNYCFDNYSNLISCPYIDIVYIALPNSLHSYYINESIKNKKKVLVEKPSFTNIRDFEITKELLLNEKVYFTEGFMYRYLPHFQKIKEIIQSNLLGKILDIESFFNIRVYKQKNFFGFKIRKPDYSNRLFNKDLGGGSILDLGCYPLSLSTFINSITYNVNLKDIKIDNIYTLRCESGVDIFSTAKLNFGGKFVSNITCSFKDKFSQYTKINFEKGSLSLDETWVPNQNMKIELDNQKEKTNFEFKNNPNIYSYQIQSISDQLLNKKDDPIFPSMTMKEIEINTKILEDWVNFK